MISPTLLKMEKFIRVKTLKLEEKDSMKNSDGKRKIPPRYGALDLITLDLTSLSTEPREFNT